MDSVVGIVVVAHSRPLAEAAVALAREMLHGRPVRIAVAAGLDDGSFGTDAVAITEALAAADGGSGVVVLMDLGSAVLSAELALDLMDDEARSRVTLCPAPLVEGLVVAAVSAAAGASREAICAEATAALAAKQGHLARPGDGTAGAPAAGDGRDEPAARGEGATASFTVLNEHGLHARPAARLVQEAGLLEPRIELRNLTTGAGPVPAGSLSRVATLGALRGHEVEVRAVGPGAEDALERLLRLAARAFDEVPPAGGPTAGGPPPPAPATAAAPAATPPAGPRTGPPAGPLTGLPASPGIGIGRAWTPAPGPVDVVQTRSEDPAGERARLDAALEHVRRDVAEVRERTARELGGSEAGIFAAHLLMLSDDELLADVRSGIESGLAAAPAWAAAIGRTADRFAALPDPYLQARAADVRDVGDQVLRRLLGAAPGGRAAPEGDVVLVAPDLSPAQAAELDPARVLAVVLAFGSPTAHGAILARARGIPCVVAAGPGVLAVAQGTLLAVDGASGEVVADPSGLDLERWQARAGDLAARRAALASRAGERARTRDGVEILVGANVGAVEEARVAARSGADLAGLVRTEFLFLDRAAAPDADEQVAAYRAIADALGGRRITLRTLDVGGDKPLPYLPGPVEANPFLGLRGLRLSLARPRLLAEQLLAMVRVAHETPVSVMFPMVSTVAELLRARQLLEEAGRAEGRGIPDGLQVGIMVEVPATALKTAAFAPHVDFLSVGTNDLTQYALAAERGNREVAALGDPLDPGVLRLVEAVCREAGEAAVGVCGELAADERATALLVGLGVRELSVAPPAVPGVKEAVRQVDTGAAAALAARALEASDAPGVRSLLHC